MLDLGINTLWLLPFYPSPLKDDGYDVSDHCDVHPDFGKLADFKLFLQSFVVFFTTLMVFLY